MPDPRSVDRPWIEAYPPGVPPNYTYPEVPLTRFLEDAVRDFPDATATWYGGATLTWAELGSMVRSLAAALLERGVGQGDRVAVVLGNVPAHPIVCFAAWWAGAIVVPVDPRLDPDEVVRRLAGTGCRAVVGPRDAPALVDRLGEAVPGVEHVLVTSGHDWLPATRRLVRRLTLRGRPGRRATRRRPLVDLGELLEGRAERRPSLATPEQVAAIHHTAGGGGTVRAVALTHANLLANAFQARLWVPDVRAARERILAAAPFSHLYGFTLGMLTGTLTAAALVLLETWDTEEVLDVVQETRPTLFPGVPEMYAALADHPRVRRHDLGSLRACVSGSAPLPPEVARRFEEVTNGARVREGYGLAEAAPLTHANPIYGRYRPGTIGLPVTDTVAIVVDPDDPSRVLGPDEPGELAIHGPQVAPAVDGHSVLPGGWLLTGDAASRDPDGFFRLRPEVGLTSARRWAS